MLSQELQKKVEALTAGLVDQGKLIEAGFASFLIYSYGGQQLPAEQAKELRQTFFAGAQHLFGSIMTFLDGGDDPTDRDMNRISLIDKELNDFIAAYARDTMPTKGSA